MTSREITITRDHMISRIPEEARAAYAAMCQESADASGDAAERAALMFLAGELLAGKSECRDGWYADNSLEMIAQMLRQGRMDLSRCGERGEIINGLELRYRVVAGYGFPRTVELASGRAAVLWDGASAYIDYDYLD